MGRLVERVNTGLFARFLFALFLIPVILVLFLIDGANDGVRWIFGKDKRTEPYRVEP